MSDAARQPAVTFSRQISLGNIISTISILGTAFLFFANIESRLTVAENRISDLNRLIDARMVEVTGRLTRESEFQTSTINRVQLQVERIEGKLDKLADRSFAAPAR